jgi:hypothetical protein
MHGQVARLADQAAPRAANAVGAAVGAVGLAAAYLAEVTAPLH